MIINHDREKLVEVVLFFAANVRKLGKTKLYKLLYFLDFKHYRDTGRPVTGLDYFAWPKGPVPKALQEELKTPASDWQGRVSFTETQTARGIMLAVKALSNFNPDHFSKRELRLLQQLADEFKHADADSMVEATHLENQPWHEIYEVQKAKQQNIPYSLALRKQDDTEMQTHVVARAEFIDAFSHE